MRFVSAQVLFDRCGKMLSRPAVLLARIARDWIVYDDSTGPLQRCVAPMHSRRRTDHGVIYALKRNVNFCFQLFFAHCPIQSAKKSWETKSCIERVIRVWDECAGQFPRTVHYARDRNAASQFPQLVERSIVLTIISHVSLQGWTRN